MTRVSTNRGQQAMSVRLASAVILASINRVRQSGARLQVEVVVIHARSIALGECVDEH